jgi:hypothetical protein
MKKAKAIVTNRGGRTCHAAIVSRELGVPAIVGTEHGTDVLHTGSDATVSCAEGDVGFVYAGALPFELERVNLKGLVRPKTKVMMNVGNPEEAFALSFIPNDGVGLAREEFIITTYIKIHPLALLDYDARRTIESSRSPKPRQRPGRREERKRRQPRYSTGWGQLGEGKASPGRGYPTMEGTSGAADRVPLRGGACEAALSRNTEPRPQGSGPWLREAEIALARAKSKPGALVPGDSGRSLRDAGNSSLRSPRAATGGVRAEWVGAKLPRERSQREVPSRGKLTSTKPLAHDISTGRVPERES